MARYLDPKNDLVFKRIFGEHPDLLISFLNSIMPLDPGQQIESLEYLPTELVPENPSQKNTIVDVRCKDNHGRFFLVEMQMCWSLLFNHRLVFNASKAYVRQMDRGKNFAVLHPVYSLGILDDVFDHKTEEFYHHFLIANCRNVEETIQGLEFVLVELPKFQPERWSDRRMAVLWLRFLREIKRDTPEAADDLLADSTIHRALDICQEAAFTPKERATYERYWELIEIEQSLHASGLKEGKKIGREEGREEGLKEGEEIGIKKGEEIGKWETTVQMVLNSRKAGLPLETIAAITGLTPEEIKEII